MDRRELKKMSTAELLAEVNGKTKKGEPYPMGYTNQFRWELLRREKKRNKKL